MLGCLLEHAVCADEDRDILTFEDVIGLLSDAAKPAAAAGELASYRKQKTEKRHFVERA